MGIGAALAVILVVSASVGGGAYAIVETGYGSAIPYIGFRTLETLAPTGNCTMISINQIADKYPVINKWLSDLPGINEIKYTVYETSASVSQVIADYHSRLSSKGYDLIDNGTVFAYGIPFTYRAYLKGATAVGIVITDYIMNHDTIVLYTTGYGQIYKDKIMPWIHEMIS